MTANHTPPMPWPCACPAKVSALGGALDLLQTHRRLQLPHVLRKGGVRGLSRHVLHEVGQAVGDGVELVVDRLLRSSLAVLQKRHHEERDDRCRGVDLELESGVEETVQATR